MDNAIASFVVGLVASALAPGASLRDLSTSFRGLLGRVSAGRVSAVVVDVPKSDRSKALNDIVVREGKALKEFGIAVFPAIPEFPYPVIVHAKGLAPVVVIEGSVTWTSPSTDEWLVDGRLLDVGSLSRRVRLATADRFLFPETACNPVLWVAGAMARESSLRHELVVAYGSLLDSDWSLVFSTIARYKINQSQMTRSTKSAIQAHALASGYDDMPFFEDILKGVHSDLLFKAKTPAKEETSVEAPPLPPLSGFEHVQQTSLADGGIECSTVLCAPANTDIDGANKHLKHLRGILSKPLKLAGPADEHAVDAWVAACYAESPWLQEAIVHIAESVKQGMGQGRKWFEFKPVLLVGPPGTGKTWLANRMTELASLPSRTIDASAATSIAPYVGTDSTWRDAQPSELVKLLATSGIANPIMIVDEIEKSGWLGATDVNAVNALLPLLEQHSAARFLDSFIKVPLRAEHASWIFLANSTKGLTIPFLDRVSVVHVAMPNEDQLRAYVLETCRRRGIDDEIAHEIARVGTSSKSLSLRRIGRAIDAAERVVSTPVLH